MNKNLLALSLAAIILLPACQSVKEELGVGRHSPDEFTVVKRAPLTLPPEYDLRPPVDGAPPASTASNSARKTLTGTPAAKVPAGSAESALLSKMGAAQADPSIRSTIAAENGYLAIENQKLKDKLIFWSDDKQPSEEAIPAPVVDPKKEAVRLKKNAKEGKPVNEGDIPVIEKKKGTIDKIF